MPTPDPLPVPDVITPASEPPRPVGALAAGSADSGAAVAPPFPGSPARTALEEPKKKKKKDGDEDGKKDKKDKGVDTMFRTSYRTNMDLSALADAKANIMISINGLIVSILLASIAPGIETNTWLKYPTVALLLGCLTSLIFAVLAARPRVQGTAVTLDEVRRGAANLLFFGNFAHLSRDEFKMGMNELMTNNAALYDNMVMDIYGVGVVLQKKYRLLRVSYTAFMVGLVVGVLAFIAVFFYFAPDTAGPTVTVPIPIIPAPSGAPSPQ